MIRPVRASDREPLRLILVSTGHFSAADIDVALELIDKATAEGDASEYYIHVIEDETESAAVVGYVCYGPTPMTDGTYDLYWIAVEAAAQGRGFGRALMRFAEDDVRRRGGRLLLIETSSQEGYRDTVRFYDRSGYVLAARIVDFYRVGDDKLIFRREMT